MKPGILALAEVRETWWAARWASRLARQPRASIEARQGWQAAVTRFHAAVDRLVKTVDEGD